jgi:hypothetical protein
MTMVEVRKAMDSVQAANYIRQDLSGLISVVDGPIRPLLQAQNIRGGAPVPAIGEVPMRAKTHVWDEQGLIAATGSTAGYAEGGKPVADFQAPTQISNTVGRFGKTAAVTDTEAALFTGAGSWRLADGELERNIQDALDLDTTLKMEEVLNEIEWCLVNGNSANNTNAPVPASPSPASGTAITSQFNGILEILGAGVLAGFGAQTGYGGGQLINAAAAPYTGTALVEQMLRDLAKNMANQLTPYMPDLLLVNASQLEVINTWHPTIMTPQNGDLTAGSNTSYYNTGFSKVAIAWEPKLPAGVMVLLNTKLLKRATLIKLGTEPLARVQTQIERMITSEMSLELRVQKAFGVVYGLAY